MNESNRDCRYDCILVGGGLQAGLLALAIRHFHANARVLMIERGSRIAGNHTWSFHPGDVPDNCRTWINPLVQHRWNGYEVRLGSFHRHVGLEYASISSDHFANSIEQLFEERAAPASASRQRVSERVPAGVSETSYGASPLKLNSRRGSDQTGSGWRLLTNTEIVDITEGEVGTRCGQKFNGDLVIDCRGPSRNSVYAGCGFQKFFGFELELASDWPGKTPVVMEGLDDQRHGFRFLYTLPFGRRRVMVEDTSFSDSPELDRDDCWEHVRAYVQGQGVTEFRIVREESGVLPMPFTGERLPSAHSPLAGGYAGGWFHAATGYSFPMAVAFASAVASGPLESAASRVNELSHKHRWRAAYGRLLNRLLYRLVAPRYRYRIFQRFYRVLSNDAIERFYSHRFRRSDAFRIVVGIPPTLKGLCLVRFVRSFLSGSA